MKQITVPTQTDLKTFAEEFYPHGSFNLDRLLRDKDVKVNGKRINKNVKLNPNDEVLFYTTDEMESVKLYDTLFEDENVLVVDKCNGVNSTGLFNTLLRTGGTYYNVHRLDRNTEGVLVFAKTEDAEIDILNAFKERRVFKKYKALVVGKFEEKSAVYEDYLLKNSDLASVRIYRTPVAGASKVITEIQVDREFEDFSEVRIILHTGRTHQVRAHTSYLGHPVIGDERYGSIAFNNKINFRRQCLIAYALSFEFNGALKYLNGKEFVSKFSFDDDIAEIREKLGRI